MQLDDDASHGSAHVETVDDVLRRAYLLLHVIELGFSGAQFLDHLLRRRDTRLVDPLSVLPVGSFGGAAGDAFTIRANLAFRNLVRAGMVRLASGQQMAALLRSRGVPVATLTARSCATAPAAPTSPP